MLNYQEFVDSKRSGFKKDYYGYPVHKCNSQGKNFRDDALTRLIQEYSFKIVDDYYVIPALNNFKFKIK